MESPFQWQIAESGYEIQEHNGISWVVARQPVTWTLYQPLKQYTGLFCDFSAVDSDEDILKFAGKHGLLVGEQHPPFTGKGPWVQAEELSDWRHQVLCFKSALNVWDALQTGAIDYLKMVIKWRKKPKRVMYEDNHSYWQIKKTHPDGSDLKFGELTWPAYRYLQDRINEALTKSVSPRMLWNTDNELRIFHVPRTLLGAMWLQFADAITYNLEFRDCKWCGRSFEVTHTTRSDRLYCSNSCRVSASRKRTRSAKRK